MTRGSKAGAAAWPVETIISEQRLTPIFSRPLLPRRSTGAFLKEHNQHLKHFGMPFWDEVMQHAEKARLIVGIGGRTLEKRQQIGTLGGVVDFDRFAKSDKPEKPWTYKGYITLSNGRKIKTVVWVPYWGGPLQWMNQTKKELFSDFCKAYMK